MYATRPRCTKIKAVAIYIPHGVVLIVLLTFCIVAADRDSGVAALTQCHEISLVVRATVSQRHGVVHFLRGCQPTLPFTQLAQGMRLNVLQPYPSPSSAVPFVGIRVAFITVVIMLRGLPVLIAIPSIGQLTAAWIGARTLWFSWHAIPPSEQKSLRFFCPRRLFSFSSA